MNNPVFFVDEAPMIEERGGLIVVTVTSGDDRRSFALTRHTMRRFLETSRRKLDSIELAEREPIPFPEPDKPGR